MLGNSTPQSNAFVDLLEGVGPVLAMLEKLTGFEIWFITLLTILPAFVSFCVVTGVDALYCELLRNLNFLRWAASGE